ncbi:MAG: serine/threonine-protein kinase [Candidatus Daviesbacteria bacterium]|nr:serine/threonine-protein kinase [Candidatus Daviesbacteria bacterium]
MKIVYLDGKDRVKQYKLLFQIGSGGFGTVYSATDTHNNKDVAIKIFQVTLNITDSEAIENWKREAEQALNIKDKNVISSYEFRKGELPDGSEKYYLVMELADGGSLDKLIESQKTKNEFIPDDQLKNFFKEILSGMKVIHEVALHRDLKPENMLFVKNVLKISDFGLAKYVDQSTRTRSFKGWGTVRYMAPESWTLGKMSQSTDIYSLGIVFYQMTTLELPYSSADDKEMQEMHCFGTIPSAKKINQNLSYKFEGIIKKMMQKSPSDRYQSVKDIIIELDKPDTQSNTDRSTTISLAKQFLEKQEQEKSEKTKKEEENQLKFKATKFKVQEIIDLINQEVEELSNFLPEEKPWLSKGTENDYTLIWGGKDLVRFHFDPTVFEANLIINGQYITAYGYAEILKSTQKDEGINFILVKNTDDDYGTWKALEITFSVFIGRLIYPLAVEYQILAQVAKQGNAIGNYQYTSRADVKEEIQKVIQKALEYLNAPQPQLRSNQPRIYDPETMFDKDD